MVLGDTDDREHTDPFERFDGTVGDDPGVDAQDLLEHAQDRQQEGEEFQALEARAFAVLLEQLDPTEPLRDRLPWEVQPWEELGDAGVTDAYEAGLLAVGENEGDDAVEAFTTAWEQYSEATSDGRVAAVAAGVALLAHVEMDMLDADAIGREAVVEAVETHEARLPEATLALYDACVGDEPRATAEELVADIDMDSEEVTRAELERAVFSELLYNLERDVTDAYERALSAIAESEAEDAVDALATAVGLYEEADEAEKHRDGAAAAVALLAHVELEMVDAAIVDRETLAEVVDRHEGDLPDAVLAVYELCTGGRPAFDSERAGPEDVDVADPDRDELEAAVFAWLFDVVADATADDEIEETGTDEASIDSLRSDYETGLEHVRDGDRQAAIGPLMDAWDRHDDVESPAGQRLAHGAGVALAALVGDDHALSMVREEVVDVVSGSEETLAEPARAAFVATTGRNPDVTASDLREVATDIDGLDALEAHAFADLLERERA